MNKYEKKYLQAICNQVSMEGDFNCIRDKIQIGKDTHTSTKKIYLVLLKVLMPCELIACCICFGLFFVLQMKPLPEDGEVQNSIEVIYLTLSIAFLFILLITFIIYQLMRKRKEGITSEN